MIFKTFITTVLIIILRGLVIAGIIALIAYIIIKYAPKGCDISLWQSADKYGDPYDTRRNRAFLKENYPDAPQTRYFEDFYKWMLLQVERDFPTETIGKKSIKSYIQSGAVIDLHQYHRAVEQFKHLDNNSHIYNK